MSIYLLDIINGAALCSGTPPTLARAVTRGSTGPYLEI